MSKITEVKYIRVSLKQIPSDDDLIERFPDIWIRLDQWKIGRKDSDYTISSQAARNKLALDDTYAEMETKVNTHLKQGWVLQGKVVWNYLNNHSNISNHSWPAADELFQTMVKYEMPKTTDLLGLFDNKASSDSESDEDS